MYLFFLNNQMIDKKHLLHQNHFNKSTFKRADFFLDKTFFVSFELSIYILKIFVIFNNKFYSMENMHILLLVSLLIYQMPGNIVRFILSGILLSITVDQCFWSTNNFLVPENVILLGVSLILINI